MGESEGSESERMQRFQQGLTVDHQLNIPKLNPSSHFRSRSFTSGTIAAAAAKRPPSHPPPLSPYSQIPATVRTASNPQLAHQSFGPVPVPSQPHHSRSLSQPAFFSLDSLPPLSPSPIDGPHSMPTAIAMDDRDSAPFRKTASLPPRKAHRRSISDIPFGFVKKESTSSSTLTDEAAAASAEDLFSAYMNLDSIEALHDRDGDDDVDSRASGSKTINSSDEDEAESGANPAKRRSSAAAAATRHCRSVSMDSSLGGKLTFGGQQGDSSFSLEFGNGEFSGAEMKKIMANGKLSEIALTDPKRVKRILANRQSAARSKERKMRYITELEHKVQTLQTEATTLSAQLTLIQRDSIGLTNQNNELKFRLQSMEQQAQLRDALNEALTTEVQRLKIATAEINGDSNGLAMFPFQRGHSTQLDVPPQQKETTGTGQ